MNNDRVLATALCENTVVNELYETNPTIIMMTETSSRSLLAICLKVVSHNLFIT